MTPIAKLKQIVAWSFSRFQDYEKCPRLAMYKHVDRIKEPSNEAMNRGSRMHEEAQAYTDGKLKKLPESLARFPEEFKALKKAKASTEAEWAFRKDLTVTSWFAQDCWLRVKVDAHTVENGVVKIVDHKSGKVDVNPKYKFGSKEVPGKHDLQAELYALGAFLFYADAKKVRVEYWYLDEGIEGALEFDVKDIEQLKKNWLARTKRMMGDIRFPTTPGRHCSWCFFSKAKGGPCEY